MKIPLIALLGLVGACGGHDAADPTSGGGSRAWVSNQVDDSVSVIDTATREVVATVAVGAAPNGLAYRAAP